MVDWALKINYLPTYDDDAGDDDGFDVVSCCCYRRRTHYTVSPLGLVGFRHVTSVVALHGQVIDGVQEPASFTGHCF